MLRPIPNDSAYVQPPSMVGPANSGRQISRTGKVEAEPQNHIEIKKESCNARPKKIIQMRCQADSRAIVRNCGCQFPKTYCQCSNEPWLLLKMFIGGPKKSLAAPEKTNFLGFWRGKIRAQGRFMMLGRTRQERLRNYLEKHRYEVLLGGWEADKNRWTSDGTLTLPPFGASASRFGACTTWGSPRCLKLGLDPPQRVSVCSQVSGNLNGLDSTNSP